MPEQRFNADDFDAAPGETHQAPTVTVGLDDLTMIVTMAENYATPSDLGRQAIQRLRQAVNDTWIGIGAAKIPQPTKQERLQALLDQLKGNENAAAIQVLVRLADSSHTELSDTVLDEWIAELEGMLPKDEPAQVLQDDRPVHFTSQSKKYPPVPHVPEGRYCLDEGRWGIKFYIVTQGKYKQFVNRLTGGPGHWRRFQLPTAAQIAVLHRIDEAGPENANKKFWQESKSCRRCGSPLTDQTQPGFVHGFGPDCYRLGWQHGDDEQ